MAENLYQKAIEDAWARDGALGIVYTTDWEGRPVIHDRMHWTLAEANLIQALFVKEMCDILHSWENHRAKGGYPPFRRG